MKKISIVTIIIGVVLVIASFVIVEFSGTNMLDSIRDFSEEKQSNLTYEEQTFTTDNLAEINVKTHNDLVKVVSSPDIDQVKVEYYTTDNIKFEINKHDSELSIKKRETNPRWWFLNFNFDERQIVIHVPADSVFDYDLVTSNGSIELTGISVDELDIETSNALVRLDNIKARDEISIETSNAKIDLNNVKSPSDIDIKTSNGLISLTGVDASAIWTKTSNALVAFTETTANTIWAKTSNGRIELDRLASGDITLDTSNATVQGSIVGVAGDFRKDISTSNGEILINESEYGKKVKDDQGAKKLVISTSNARVDISFKD